MLRMPDDPRSDRPPPEQPRHEPEIIPPGREDPRWTGDMRRPDSARVGPADAAIFVTVDEHGRTQYRTFTPPGPFTIGIVLTVLGLVGAAILMLALGFVLFLIPVVAIIVGGLLLSGRLRQWWNRLERN
jgi:hypothetical protein